MHKRLKKTLKSGRSCWKIKIYLHKRKCFTIFQKLKLQCRRCCLSTLKRIFGEYVWDSRAHRMNRRHGWCQVLFCDDSFACFGVGSLKLHVVSTFWNVKDSRVHVWVVCDFITFNNVGHQSSNAQHWIQCLNLHWTQFNSISWAWLELNECLAWCLGHTRKSCAPKCVCVCVCVCVCDFGSNSCRWSSCYTESWNHRQKNNG